MLIIYLGIFFFLIETSSSAIKISEILIFFCMKEKLHDQLIPGKIVFVAQVDIPRS